MKSRDGLLAVAAADLVLLDPDVGDLGVKDDLADGGVTVALAKSRTLVLGTFGHQAVLARRPLFFELHTAPVAFRARSEA